MRKLALLTSFFSLTPIVLILSFLLLTFISSQKNTPALSFGKAPKVAYAAIQGARGTMSIKINGKDARITAVENFFSYYKSALTPYAKDVVAAADKYSIDYRLIPAIAMQESTLCKKTPKNSFNCWGFGIYGKKVTKFIEAEIVYEADGTPKVRGVERVSKFSKRVYQKAKELRPVKYGTGLMILTTPKGIMTNRAAKKENVGGEVLFKIW